MRGVNRDSGISEGGDKTRPPRKGEDPKAGETGKLGEERKLGVQK